MSDLSPSQKAAIQYVNGPLLVLAGAGSGKTSLLVHKAAWLIREYGVPPDEIGLLASCARAARFMRTQLADLIHGRPAQEIFISTFPAFGLRLVQASLEEFGLRPGFSVYTPEESRALLARLMPEEGQDTAHLTREIEAHIARFKRDAYLPPVPPSAHDARDRAARLYAQYEERLQAANALDLGDLALRPLQLLGRRPGVGRLWRGRLRYLLVDEYEETTTAQHLLTRRLIDEGVLLTAAGDDDQCVGSARGARPENLLRLREEVPALRHIRLEQNFRSTGRVLKAAHSVIAHNGAPLCEKPLWSDRSYGEPLRVYRAPSEEHEAERLVAALLAHKSANGTEFRHYAILLRHPCQSGPIERALRQRRIPYYMQDAPALFDQVEVRDVLAGLRLLCNPADDEAFVRVINTPRREVDRATLDELERHARATGTNLLRAARDRGLASRLAPERLSALTAFVTWIAGLIERVTVDDPIALVRDLLNGQRYEEWLQDTCNDRKIAEGRMENVLALIGILQRFIRRRPAARLPEIYEKLRHDAVLGLESEEPPGDAVSLMTLAEAKGTEFRHVIIPGMEEGLLPGSDEESMIQADRRLLYVGMTRARDTLSFTLAERRRRGGEVAARRPSRFLAELPQSEIEWVTGESGPGAEASLGRGGGLPATLHPFRRDS